MDDIQQLEKLFTARHGAIAIQTHEEHYALQTVHEAAVAAGRSVRQWSVISGVRDGLIAGKPCVPNTTHPAAALLFFTELRDDSVVIMLDLAVHLKDDRTLRLARDLLFHCHETDLTLVLIDHREDLPAVVVDYVTRCELSLPNEAEIQEIVRDTIAHQRLGHRVEVELSRPALDAIVRNLRGLSRRQVREIIIECVADDRRFDAKDLATVLLRKRQMVQTGGLLEFVEAPVSLDMIGGMKRLKAWLKARETAWSDRAEAFGLTAPRGILLLGVQGAGKSLCAKAIATAWQRPLLRMDVGALYDKYIGESERRLRDSLRQAEVMAPIVLWIDEIEKAFASAASQSTDGGLSRRMFGSLLTWMQEHASPVFLAATANDIGALPPELLRKGRFDEIFFIDLPDAATRRDILAIHLKKRQRSVECFDLDALAQASNGFSGAELEQAVLSGLHAAFSASRDMTTQDILTAIRESPPLSVTMREQVEALRAWAKGRCVPAD